MTDWIYNQSQLVSDDLDFILEVETQFYWFIFKLLCSLWVFFLGGGANMKPQVSTFSHFWSQRTDGTRGGAARDLKPSVMIWLL